MDAYRVIRFSAEALDGLRRELADRPEVTPFTERPELAERLACVGIAREVGTPNDELARFIFDAESGRVVERSSLRSEFVEWRGNIGVRVWSVESSRLELRARWTEDFLHPTLSENADGTLRGLFIFPKLIAEVTALQGVALVIVKSWAMNSIFGGFDPAKEYYQTNFWELENNDSFLFAKLLRDDRLALIGTHDLIAHVAGVRRARWNLVRAQADRAHRAIEAFFAGGKSPTIASLILPYTIGVVLDDLAQPPSYGSASHGLVLEVLLEELERRRIPPGEPATLLRFPKPFERVIAASRNPASARNRPAVRALVGEMVVEIQNALAR